MYFYNLIKKYNEPLNIFVDMDGVIADYDFDHNLDFKSKRPIKTNIKTLKKISELENINLYILSICKENSQINEKNEWLDKNAPYFKKENRIILSKDDKKNKSSKDLKYEYLKKFLKDNKKIIVIDDDNEILKYLKKNLKEVILFQDSSIID